MNKTITVYLPRAASLVTADGQKVARIVSMEIELHADALPEPAKPRQERPATKERREAVERIWQHYVALFTPRTTALSPTHRRLIEAALKLRSEPEILQAIDGLRVSPFHNGQNDRDQKYLALRYAIRGNRAKGEGDDDRIDKMAAMAPKEAVGDHHVQATEARVRRWLEAVQYTLEHPGTEVDRARDAKQNLEQAGYEVKRLDGPPFARIERR